MKKTKDYGYGMLVAYLLIWGCLLAFFIINIIEAIIAVAFPSCSKSGCSLRPVRYSEYCEYHKEQEDAARVERTWGRSYSSSNKTKAKKNSGKSSRTSRGRSYGGYTSRGSGWSSYDDGYNDVYMDGDYDWDRYRSDIEYANGVEDAGGD